LLYRKRDAYSTVAHALLTLNSLGAIDYSVCHGDSHAKNFAVFPITLPIVSLGRSTWQSGKMESRSETLKPDRKTALDVVALHLLGTHPKMERRFGTRSGSWKAGGK
jgi:hypothetical protein